MKRFSRYFLILGISVGGILLTVDSCMARNTIYGQYEYDVTKSPVMSLSLRRIFDREKPLLLMKAMGESVDEAKPETEVANADSEKPSDENTGNASDSAASADSAGDAASSNDANAAEQGSSDVLPEANTSGQDSSDTTAGDNQGTEDSKPEDTPATKEPEEVYVMTEVSDDYFADALFIGDSRTVGLSEYCQPLMDIAQFYAKVSLTIYDFNKKEFVEVPVVTENPGGEEAAAEAPAETAESTDAENQQTEMVTIEEALTRRQFGKIYIMLGLNELGNGTTETFCESYRSVVNRIRELQPDAIIYIQGIMHVTADKSDHDKIFRNEIINERNMGLSQLADNEHVFYINMNEATDDENGNLLQDLSFDNIHLKAKSYSLWYDYLKTHAYVKMIKNDLTE